MFIIVIYSELKCNKTKKEIKRISSLVVGKLLSVKAQLGNILGFVHHTILVITVKLCHCSAKAARDKMLTDLHGCAPIKLY